MRLSTAVGAVVAIAVLSAVPAVAQSPHERCSIRIQSWRLERVPAPARYPLAQMRTGSFDSYRVRYDVRH